MRNDGANTTSIVGTRDTPPVRWRGRWTITLAMAAVGAVLTIGLSWRAKRFADLADELHYTRLIARDEEAIRERLSVYEDAVRGGAAFIASSPSVTPDAWESYVRIAWIIERCPGMHRIGVIYPVKESNLDAFVERQRSLGEPGFAVKTLRPISTMPAMRLRPAQSVPAAGSGAMGVDPVEPERFILTMVAPRAGNEAVLGLDLSSEPSRSIAAQDARDTGRPTISDPVSLLNSSSDEPGFVLYCPIYRQGMRTSTVAERRAAFVGWTSLSAIYDDVLESVPRLGSHEITVTLYNGVTPRESGRLASSAVEPGARDERVTHMTLAGRELSAGWNRTAQFVSTQRSLHWWILAGGGAMTLLASSLTMMLATSESRVRDEVVARTRDLTRANAALAESQERFQRAADGSSVGIWDWNVRTGEDYLSPRWKALLGYEDHELPNEVGSWTGQIHPDDASRVLTTVEAHLQHHKPYDIELRMRCKDGEYRWFHARGQATWDANGSPVRMAGSLVDVHARKLLEDERNDMLERQRQATAREILLRRELDHRVRNNLLSLLSLVRLYERTNRGIAEFSAALRGKIVAMREAHALLSETPERSLELRHLLERFVVSVGDMREKFELEGPDVLVPAQQVGALSMVIEELMTNARKYGALRSNPGRVRITWCVCDPPPDATSHTGDDRSFHLRWVESNLGPRIEGKPDISTCTESTRMGWKLIEGLVASDLRGSCAFSLSTEGLTFDLTVHPISLCGAPMAT